MFIYILTFNGPVAQLLERTPDKREVGSSHPPLNKIVWDSYALHAEVFASC